MEQGADYELVTSPKAAAQPAPAPSAATPIESSVGAAATAVSAAQPATTIVESGEKRSDAARAAFEKGDAQLSRAVHEAKKVNVEDHGGQAADYVKSLIFGGLDGVVTTLATIASAFGAKMSIEAVILLSVSNLIAEAISMGLGDFISSKAEYDFLKTEKAREEWEYDNHPEGEKSEMVDLLKEKGIEEADATRIIEIVSKTEHKEFFVNYMMIEELGLEIPDDPWGPAKDGIVTFFAFILFGFVPVAVYIFSWVGKWENSGGVFGVACAFTVVALFALGATQAKISKLPMLKNGALMAINGSIAAAAAYLVSWGLLAAVGCS